MRDKDGIPLIGVADPVRDMLRNMLAQHEAQPVPAVALVFVAPNGMPGYAVAGQTGAWPVIVAGLESLKLNLLGQAMKTQNAPTKGTTQ